MRDAAVEHVLRGAPVPDVQELEFWLGVNINWGDEDFHIVINMEAPDFCDSNVEELFVEASQTGIISDAMRVAYVRDYFGPRLERDGDSQFPTLHFYPLTNDKGETVLAGCYYFLDGEGFVLKGFHESIEAMLLDMATKGDLLLEHCQSLRGDQILHLWWPDREPEVAPDVPLP